MRPIIALAPAVVIAAFVAGTPVNAQQPAALEAALRACRSIGQIAARVACYDGLIDEPLAASIQADTAPPEASPPRSFGSESVRQLPSQVAAARGEETAVLRVISSTMREPGVYLLTLEDDAQWLFAESAPNSYAAPRAGASVTLIRGAVGGYLLRYAGQASIRVRRAR